MFNTNDILARLQNGESAEAIVQEFTNSINEANAQYKAAQEAAKMDQQKIAAARDLIIAMDNYLYTCHPNSSIIKELPASENPTDEDCKRIMEQLDSMIELFDTCATAFAPIKVAVKTSTKAPEQMKSAPSIDSIFEDFFKKMNI